MSRPSQPQRGNSLSRVFVAAILILSIGLLAMVILSGPSQAREALVVYCAHDAVFSDAILRQFEKETNIRVSPVYDTEATKSLGLVERLIHEKESPRCDVFWNNQLLGTLALADHGLLVPYRGTGHARIPDRYKDPDGKWVGLGGRLRVYIVNTQKMPNTPQAVEAALQGDLTRMAIARPLFGTTLSHYSLLWHVLGPESLKRWHHDVRQRGLREVPGNATVKNLVAAGTCDFGWTDTDDYFAAVDEGKPVAMLPIQADGRWTICIPNTVAIIKDTDKLEQAQKLVDYLASAKIELQLARSKARQIPLGPVERDKLPPDVAELTQWVERGYDLSELGKARNECLEWLKSEYLE